MVPLKALRQVVGLAKWPDSRPAEASMTVPVQRLEVVPMVAGEKLPVVCMVLVG